MSTEPWRPNPAPTPDDRPVSRVPDRLLRIGDRERERAAAALGEHYAAGRLERGELDERLDAAYAARTLADLERLFADLPEPAPFRPDRPRRPAPPPERRPRVHAELAVIPLVCALLVLFVVLTALLRFPPFPLFFFIFWIVGARRRRVWL
jgi:hypothetical protein